MDLFICVCVWCVTLWIWFICSIFYMNWVCSFATWLKENSYCTFLQSFSRESALELGVQEFKFRTCQSAYMEPWRNQGGGTKEAYLVLMFELWTLWFVFLNNLIMFKFCDFVSLCFKLSKTNIWKLCFGLCKFVLILTFILDFVGWANNSPNPTLQANRQIILF